MNKGLLIGLIVLALVVIITIAVVVVIVLLKHSSPTTTSSSSTTTSSSTITTKSASPTTTKSASPTSSNTHNKGDTLFAGQSLLVGDYLQSQNGKYIARLGSQTNRLMINGIFIYPVETDFSPSVVGSTLTMQPNGNLVIYSAAGSACWAISTSDINGKGNAPDPTDKNTRLVLQNDGYLVVYNAKNIPWWKGWIP